MRLYYYLIFTASFFNKKARLWINGRKNIFKKIEDFNLQNTTNIWFHVSSLGEFEQGRPIIEQIKNNFPEFKIVLTFFSPSGYEIRKNYKFADYILYLPLDTKKNATKFISIINPKAVFFVKYDIWFHYLNTLFIKSTPTFLISAIFRQNQIFFRWYGKWYKKALSFFTKIYVQNQFSLDLLLKNNVTNAVIAGDTRLDRVFDIPKAANKYNIIDKFRNNKLCIVCGSTWEIDEKILTTFLNSTKHQIKFVIAPHEIHKQHLEKLILMLNKSYILYSKAENEDIVNYDILIIDNIGMLSSIYQYADIAYIGGGFGNGIHNILEPAAWGIPIVFGPKYNKFQEAVDLIKLKAAYSISNRNDFFNIITKLISEVDFRNECGQIAEKYIIDNKGASHLIFSEFIKLQNK